MLWYNWGEEIAMRKEKSITLSDATGQVLAQVNGPISVDEFARRVFAIFPSRARRRLSGS